MERRSYDSFQNAQKRLSAIESNVRCSKAWIQLELELQHQRHQMMADMAQPLRMKIIELNQQSVSMVNKQQIRIQAWQEQMELLQQEKLRHGVGILRDLQTDAASNGTAMRRFSHETLEQIAGGGGGIL
jgi:hypothetical protein